MKKKKTKDSITAVVLAAGKGVRMKSSLPKVLHTICGKSLIYYSLSLLSQLRRVRDIVAVLGYKRDLVRREVNSEFKNIRFAYQDKLNGSAKAVEASLRRIKGAHVLVFCADSPLLDKKAIEKAISFHLSSNNVCTVLTKDIPRARGLGRIIRGPKGEFLRIKEELELLGPQRLIEEVNTGIYLFRRKELSGEIRNIKKNPKKKEYFLTDIVDIFRAKACKVRALKIPEESLFFSGNSLQELIRAEEATRLYLIGRLIDKGVKVIDPRTTFLGPKTRIGRNSVIYPFTFLGNNVTIGNRCAIGPFARLREGTVVKNNSYVGNFTELVRSRIGSFVKMKHLSYMGDADVGNSVNIGAGTVVANFDGKKKHKTLIKEGAFIGSDSVLVAPLKVGKGAFTGAGSVVIRDVAAGSTVAGVPAKKLKKKKR